MTYMDRIFERERSANRRFLLDWVDKKWYVETAPDSEGNAQGGDVVEVIRDKYDVPVCLKVKYGKRKVDYISVDRVAFYEPYARVPASVGMYDDCNEWVYEYEYD